MHGPRKAGPFVAINCAALPESERELLQAAANGESRQDLFYRVAVRRPPLRERVEDLPELVRASLGRLAKSADRPVPELGRDAQRALSALPFPGNIPELESILTRAFVISGGARIGASDLELNRRAAPVPRSKSRKAFAVEERQRILEAQAGPRAPSVP